MKVKNVRNEIFHYSDEIFIIVPSLLLPIYIQSMLPIAINTMRGYSGGEYTPAFVIPSSLNTMAPLHWSLFPSIAFLNALTVPYIRCQTMEVLCGIGVSVDPLIFSLNILSMAWRYRS